MALATSRVSSPPSTMAAAATTAAAASAGTKPSTCAKGTPTTASVSSRELRAKRRLSYSGSGSTPPATRRKVSDPSKNYYSRHHEETTNGHGYHYSHMNSSHHHHHHHHHHHPQEAAKATPPETNGESPSSSRSSSPAPTHSEEEMQCRSGAKLLHSLLAPVSANTRSKSVSFDIANNKEYEASPLLTPKYEDEDDYDDYTKSHTALSSDVDVVCKEEDDEEINDDPSDLNRNPDYSALCASLEMLHSKESQIHSEITQLANLKSSLEHMSKSNLIGFYMRLLQGQVHLPTPSKLPKAPVVQWGKYGLSDKVGDCLKGTMAVKEHMEQGLKVFDDSTNSRVRTTSLTGEFSYDEFKY